MTKALLGWLALVAAGAVCAVLAGLMTLSALLAGAGAAPLRLAVSQDGMSVVLAWDPPADLTNVQSYLVGYGTAPGVYTQAISAGNLSTVTVPLPTSALTTRYFFAVRTVPVGGDLSDWSNEVSTGTPPGPTPTDGPPTLRTVSVTSDPIAGSSKVALSWDPAIAVSGYKIYGGQSGSRAYSVVNDVGLATTGTLTVATPATPTTFYFAVTSYIVGTPFQESVFSNELVTVIPAGAPAPSPECAPPFGNRVVALTITGFKRTIDAAGALAYVDYLATSPNVPVTRINLLLNGNLWRTGGGGVADVMMFGRVWFNLPTAPGTYTVSLEASNGPCKAVQSKDASGKPIVVVVK